MQKIKFKVFDLCSGGTMWSRTETSELCLGRRRLSENCENYMHMAIAGIIPPNKRAIFCLAYHGYSGISRFRRLGFVGILNFLL
jgi:hypothetical protein